MGVPQNEGFDHMTVVVTDLDEARRFFGLLGFVERIAVVASGDEIARYMGIPGWEADHVTLVLEGAPVHQEVQLLRFHRPAAATSTRAPGRWRGPASTTCASGSATSTPCWRTSPSTGSPRATRCSTSTTGASCSSTGRASWWSSPSGWVGRPARAVT